MYLIEKRTSDNASIFSPKNQLCHKPYPKLAATKSTIKQLKAIFAESVSSCFSWVNR
jgi:hypothetical protein